MKIRNMRCFLLAIMLISNIANAQSAKEVISQYLDTVSNGNFDNWTRVKSAYVESEVFFSQDNIGSTIAKFVPNKTYFHKQYRVWPDKDKIEVYEDSSFSTLLSEFSFLKDKCIIKYGNLPPFETSSAGKYSSTRQEPYFEFEPVKIGNLIRSGAVLELVGVVSMPQEENTFYEIKVIKQDVRRHLFFNTNTYLLEYMHSGDPAIQTRLYNYKKIGQLLIPMSSITTKNGQPYFWSDANRIELNIEINESVFRIN